MLGPDRALCVFYILFLVFVSITIFTNSIVLLFLVLVLLSMQSLILFSGKDEHVDENTY